MGKPILGCIADDLTGATDLANNLARSGMRVVLMTDISDDSKQPGCEALVVALKSRTVPAADAVRQSRQACRCLLAHGVRQIYFKICSTFDSTPEGNIGPVIEALMAELKCHFCPVVPAFPDAGRTVYKGHLFVGDTLLSESGMRNHPTTPMTDSNLVRFLQSQLTVRRTGLIEHAAVSHSAHAICESIIQLHATGLSIAIADTVTNDDLHRLGEALATEPLVAAGSGLALEMPAWWGFKPSQQASTLPESGGSKAILCGSCSAASNAQVARFIACGGAARRIDPLTLAENMDDEIARTLEWARASWGHDAASPVLVHSTTSTDAVNAVHARLGAKRAGEMVEVALAALAVEMVRHGAGRLIIGGGETAGICARAIGATRMQIGAQIDPGVPWCYAPTPLSPLGAVHISLKSGNFGSDDFFTKAFTVLH